MKIKQNKNGTYSARLRIKVDGKWKEKRLTDNSKNNLMYRASKIMKKVESEDYSTKKWKIKEFYELFISTFKEGKSSQATLDLYRLAYDQLFEYFGDVPLDSIDAVKYQQFINYLGETYSRATVDTRHRKIRAIFNKAVALGYMKKNPAIGAQMSGEDVSKNKVQFMQTDKVHLLIEELTEFYSISRAVIFLAIKTGMRYEEIIALTKNDIDITNKVIIVNKAWDYKYTHNFVETKNKSSRNIHMDEQTIDYVKKYMEWHSQYLQENHITNTLSLLFHTFHNKPVDNASCNKVLKKICKKIGSEEITLHKLRHTHTGLCVEAGMDIIYVADRLGHDDINTTLKYYSHLSESLRQNNQLKFNQFFGEIATKNATNATKKGK
jgi:integrase